MDQTVIFGAGPAGLAAAWRLTRDGRPVIVIEREGQVGGLCRSLQVDDCTFDIGPHLFKPRSQAVSDLWDLACGEDYAPEVPEASRIYLEGGLHPSNAAAILAQPRWKIAQMGAQLVAGTLRPGPVTSAEDLLCNMRGQEIYQALYRPHWEKLWGKPLSQIDPRFYATQTVDLFSSLYNRLASVLSGQATEEDPPEDTFRPRARFPSRGSGALYDRVRELSREQGEAQFILGAELIAVEHEDGRVHSVVVREGDQDEPRRVAGTDFISTIPLQSLVASLAPAPPNHVLEDAARLFHRDLVLVSLVLEPEPPFPYDRVDSFSQELELFRVTHFSGLSPQMAGVSGQQSIGVEYYCFEGDSLWERDDASLVALAAEELVTMGLIEERHVVGSRVVRVRDACPVQIVGYREVAARLLEAVNALGNLQSIGRNGLFTYNQMSHSVECGLQAAENVLGANHQIDPPGASESLVF